MLPVGNLCCWMGTSTQLLIVLDGTWHMEDLLQTTSIQVGMAGELQEFLYENVEKGAWARVS